MRQFVIAAICAGVVSCAYAEDPAAENRSSDKNSTAEPLTVMTWNLEWFFDDNAGDNYSELAKEKSSPSRGDWDWKRDAVAASIAKCDPSILAFQEVENRRVLWYLTRSLARNHQLEYHELGMESRDHYTEQDVGFLYRPPVDARTVMQDMYSKRLRSKNQYFDLSKHLRAVFEVQTGKTTETVMLLNIHFRARAEAADKRIRQARLLHHWIAAAIGEGKNIIVLGDFNTEFKGDHTDKLNEIGIACGLETESMDDDLFDLNLKLPASDRETHLLGGQYDRILCSRSLIEDDPMRVDLVFSKIEVLRDLVIRNGKDSPEQHWDHFWKMPEADRDLSDHYPVMATFEIR